MTKAVLIVEDDESFRYTVAQHVKAAGFNAIAVPDSMAALKELENKQSIDLLLIDIGMPTGMPHGLALALMAKQRRGPVPVIFLTGYKELLEAAGDLPGKVFYKPVNLTEVIEEIKSQLAV